MLRLWETVVRKTSINENCHLPYSMLCDSKRDGAITDTVKDIRELYDERAFFAHSDEKLCPLNKK